MALGDGAEIPDHRGRGEPAGRVVGQRDDDGREAQPLGDSVELGRVGDAADTGQANDVEAVHGGLGGVADPTGLGQHNAAAASAENGPQQGFAAGTGDDLGRLGGQAASGPVAGGRFQQGGNAGYRAVGRTAGGGREGGGQQGMHGKAGFAEAEGHHGQAGGAAAGDGVVGGERGGNGHAI